MAMSEPSTPSTPSTPSEPSTPSDAWHQVLRRDLTQLRDTDPAEALALLRLVSKFVKMETLHAVQAAHRAGLSWAEMGAILHVDEEVMRKRYAGDWVTE